MQLYRVYLNKREMSAMCFGLFSDVLHEVLICTRSIEFNVYHYQLSYYMKCLYDIVLNDMMFDPTARSCFEGDR